MAAYVVANYRIKNPSEYQKYLSSMLPILQAHDSQTLIADHASETLEGHPGHVTIVIKFASKEAARNWYYSPEYQAVLHLRTASSEGSVVLVDEFVPSA